MSGASFAAIRSIKLAGGGGLERGDVVAIFGRTLALRLGVLRLRHAEHAAQLVQLRDARRGELACVLA